ncbi:hypothetical protein L1887_22644 [Cichorium endivia]|nr:hypothetical protein L1887_22644 [Cichorium endivia]
MGLFTTHHQFCLKVFGPIFRDLDDLWSSGYGAISDIRITMAASHTQIVKTWCKHCLLCVKKYPIPICFIILFFLAYLFVPLVYTVLIYSSPLVGLSFLVHRFLLGVDRRKIKKAEQDDKRKKFAKSRRSFKSNRNQLSRRNTKTKSDNFNYSDTDFEYTDDIFSKSLNELLADTTPLIEKKPKKRGDVNVESVVGRGESSSSYDYQLYGKVNDNYKDELKLGRSNWDTSADEDDEPRDKGVRWTGDDQKMDLGLVETDRHKRLEGMMQRRRSKKNLGFQDKGETGNNNNGQISAIKVVKLNPFLEVNSCGKNEPGSAPSALLATRNPFDLPYDPHEEKPDLSGDDFHEEFTVRHHKEPTFCRHQSFRLGAFSHPDATHDKHDMSFYHDLASKRFTLDNKGDYKHTQQDRKLKEYDFQRNDSFERKADIMFFYGGKKRVGHAPSSSIVSDLQVELSDEETSLKDLDIEKDKRSWLNLSNLSKGESEVVVKSDGEEDHEHYVASENNPGIISSSVVSTDLPSSSTQEMDNRRPQLLNSETVASNHLQESSAASQSSVDPPAPDGLTEVAVRQAHVTSSSPKSVLERGFSTDQASPHHVANENQQSDNHTREAENGFRV